VKPEEFFQKRTFNLSQKFVLITGCSGGGKSTLISMLNEKGFNTVTEPGRRIVAEEMANNRNGNGKTNGSALP
jgi:predicted ATPase